MRPPPSALDPDGGRSLSIVEIGGQDAKFINVATAASWTPT